MTVMRTADAERRKQYDLLMQQASHNDDYMLNRMFSILTLNYLQN